MFVVLSISCTRLAGRQHLLLLMCSLGLLGWLPLTLARLSVRLFLLLFVCLSVPAPATVCLLAQKICYRPLGSYTLRRSQTAHSNLSRSPAVLDSSSHVSMFPCVCESDCVLVGVLCSVLFASVSLTLSFIICTTNSWALQEDNLHLMRFSYVWGLGNMAESSII